MWPLFVLVILFFFTDLKRKIKREKLKNLLQLGKNYSYWCILLYHLDVLNKVFYDTVAVSKFVDGVRKGMWVKKRRKKTVV